MSSQERFSRLWAEWEAAKRQQADRVTRKLAQWEESFRTLEAEYYDLRLSGVWLSGPSSLFEIIGQSRRETYHCSVLAWLMDPTGRHGLGHRFLQRLLQKVAPTRSYESRALARAIPRCEVVAPNCRADIVVTGFTSTLVVEAKVDAAERPRQCNDVFGDFRYQPDPQFVFLTPDGREPKTATGEASAVFQALSFSDCLEILVATIDNHGFPADDIAEGSIRNYLTTLKEEFAT